MLSAFKQKTKNKTHNTQHTTHNTQHTINPEIVLNMVAKTIIMSNITDYMKRLPRCLLNDIVTWASPSLAISHPELANTIVARKNKVIEYKQFAKQIQDISEKICARTSLPDKLRAIHELLWFLEVHPWEELCKMEKIEQKTKPTFSLILWRHWVIQKCLEFRETVPKHVAEFDSGFRQELIRCITQEQMRILNVLNIRILNQVSCILNDYKYV